MARAPDDTTLHLASRASRASHGLVLRVFSEDGASAHPLPRSGTVLVGRAEEAQIRITDGSISRRHAKLHVGESLVVEDLGSANGVTVAGRLLDAGERAPISVGTPIELGTVVLVVQDAPAAEDARDVAPAPAPRSTLSAAMRELDGAAARVARSTLAVLIRGETGVGKDVLAQSIHRRSKRASGPLLCVNCGAFAESLLDSELFGHERGAFTGATQAKPGLLESAEGGTVFLDEVGELPPSLQVKLLRVLETKRVRRVGALEERPLDVRFISATNRDLAVMVREGKFREDLLFRLDGVTLSVPPLRERVEEIVPLARAFLEAFARAEGARPKRLADGAIAALRAHAWPGNVRELRNAMERAAVLAVGDVIGGEQLRHLRTAATATSTAGAREPEPEPGRSRDLPSEIKELEKRRILEALDACGGSQTRAAKMLGIPRPKLMARLEAFGIPRPRKR